MIPTKRHNDEVYFTDARVAAVGQEEIDWLKAMAESNPRKRCRLCLHHDVAAAVHEMLLVHKRGIYVPPHKHVAKTESLHIVEGVVDLVCFSEDGDVTEVVRLEPPGPGSRVCCRLVENLYHSLVIVSPWMVALETTMGPFSQADRMVTAHWAPGEGDDTRGALFMKAALARHEERSHAN